MLKPIIALRDVFPKNAAFMSRTNLHETRMLGFKEVQLDSVTAYFFGVMNGLSTVRHVAAKSGSAEFFEHAGIEINEDTRYYETEEEAEAHADALIKEAKKFFWPYPLPQGRYPESAQIITSDLYRTLNSKANLGMMVDSEFLPQRKLLSLEELADFETKYPVVLKAAGDAATGWGFAVHFCESRAELTKAKDWMYQQGSSVPLVVVEEKIALKNCWCAGIAVSATKTECFGGAEQIFSAPGRQAGNLIDSENAFPQAARRIVAQIGEKARELGFCGIAGVDIGLAENGRFYVFDLNFRFNASSTQLLFHESAVKQSGFPVSHSIQVEVQASLDELQSRIFPLIDEGRFVPSRFFNGDRHAASCGIHIINGFVYGTDRQEVIHVLEDCHSRIKGKQRI